MTFDLKATGPIHEFVKPPSLPTIAQYTKQKNRIHFSYRKQNFLTNEVFCI